MLPTSGDAGTASDTMSSWALPVWGQGNPENYVEAQ